MAVGYVAAGTWHIVDFTNPAACEWYQERSWRRFLDMGVDCFKTDFGERIPTKTVVYYDGSDPSEDAQLLYLPVQ